MTFTAWHGGRAYFTEFSEDSIGSGEGTSLGWGFYFAEHRKGAEYFAEYMNFRDGQGYLYEVELDIRNDQILPLDLQITSANPRVQERVLPLLGNLWSYSSYNSAYCHLREKFGDKEASTKLRSIGILAVSAYEETKPGHGISFLVLDRACIRLSRVFKFSKNPYGWQLQSTA